MGGTVLAAEFTAEQLEFFERKVRPVLVERCYSCHSAEAKKLKGELHLDSRAGFLKGGESGHPSLVVGDPGKSRLIEAIAYENQDLQMPPKGRLSPEAIADLTEWVKLGAPWPKEAAPQTTSTSTKKGTFDLKQRRSQHWAWRPLQRPPQPAVRQTDWPRQPTDRFLLASLESAGLKPAPPTSRATLLRRLYFDLIGLPPDPRELAAFEADTDPDAVGTVVDQLLSSPRFGERWARHWLDLVRFSETLAHEFDYPRHNAWRYRDYVIRALNTDVPYDTFVREHIAGDLMVQPRFNLEDGANESLIGTGFWWFGQQTHSPVDVQVHQAEFIDNQIDVVTKTFLGLTVACARCHDHKFDAISTRDFYSLYGVLSSSRYAQRAIDPATNRTVAVLALHELKAQLKPHLADAWIDATALLPTRLSERATNAAVKRLRETFPLTHHVSVAAVPLASPAPARSTEFTGDLPPGWTVDGDAFEDCAVRPGDLIIGTSGQPLARWITEPGWNSARFSPRLTGSLRSPTEVISNRYVHLRCSGRDSRFNIVIANFTIIQAPIYGDLRRVLDHDEPRWITVDVGRWQGLRAYLEFCDLPTGDPGGGGRAGYGPNGWVGLNQVVWSDQAQPPGANLAAGPASAEPMDAWAHRVQQQARAALLSWRQATSNPSADDATGFRLLDHLIALGLLEPAPGTTPQFAGLLERYQKLAASFPEPRLVPAMTDGTPLDERVFVRGNPRTLGEPVPRRFLEALGGDEQEPFHEGSGRMEFADRLLDPSNPLPARVLVNRVWLHLFGRGLVPTPDDFGALGQPPSHPELLDWLADWFRNEGDWSTKKLIRLLATSQAYSMASVDSDPRASEIDPENILLHRMNVRRMEGEIIRDSLLKLSGRLDTTQYGPSVPTHLTDFMEGRGRPGVSGPRDGAGRRSIYLEVRNNFLSPMMRTFDTPVPFTTVGRRTLSNVPAQSLILMNDPFVLDQARLWAEQTLAQGKSLEPADRIIRLYESAYGRRPTADELSAATAFLKIQADALGFNSTAPIPEVQVWTDLCHALLNVKDFIYIN